MFELIVAWSVFTFVLGKGVESVTHAVKGTTPPSHQRRMAKLHAKHGTEGSSAAVERSPRSGVGNYIRGLWADHWDLQATKHADKWPQKAERARARAAERTVNRREVWDEVQGKAEKRWRRRIAERAPAAPTQPEPSTPEEPAPTTPEPSPPEGADEPGDSVSAKGRAPEPTPAEENDPNSGGRVIDFPRRGDQPDPQPDMKGATVAGEIMGLGGTTRFTRDLAAGYKQLIGVLEGHLASMRTHDVGDELIQKFSLILSHVESLSSTAQAALADCEEQMRVRDAYEAAPEAGDKEYVTKQ